MGGGHDNRVSRLLDRIPLPTQGPEELILGGLGKLFRDADPILYDPNKDYDSRAAALLAKQERLTGKTLTADQRADVLPKIVELLQSGSSDAAASAGIRGTIEKYPNTAPSADGSKPPGAPPTGYLWSQKWDSTKQEYVWDVVPDRGFTVPSAGPSAAENARDNALSGLYGKQAEQIARNLERVGTRVPGMPGFVFDAKGDPMDSRLGQLKIDEQKEIARHNLQVEIDAKARTDDQIQGTRQQGEFQQGQLTESRLSREQTGEYQQGQLGIERGRLANDVGRLGIDRFNAESTARAKQQENSLSRNKFVADILGKPSDFMARVITQRGLGNPTPVTQADLINQLNTEFAGLQPGQSLTMPQAPNPLGVPQLAQGGMVNDPKMIVGDPQQAGVPNPELILNPTGAPIGVVPMNRLGGQTPMYAQGTGQPSAQPQVDPETKLLETKVTSLGKLLQFVDNPNTQHELVDELAFYKKKLGKGMPPKGPGLLDDVRGRLSGIPQYAEGTDNARSTEPDIDYDKGWITQEEIEREKEKWRLRMLWPDYPEPPRGEFVERPYAPEPDRGGYVPPPMRTRVVPMAGSRSGTDAPFPREVGDYELAFDNEGQRIRGLDEEQLSDPVDRASVWVDQQGRKVLSAGKNAVGRLLGNYGDQKLSEIKSAQGQADFLESLRLRNPFYRVPAYAEGTGTVEPTFRGLDEAQFNALSADDREYVRQGRDMSRLAPPMAAPTVAAPMPMAPPSGYMGETYAGDAQTPTAAPSMAAPPPTPQETETVVKQTSNEVRKAALRAYMESPEGVAELRKAALNIGGGVGAGAAGGAQGSVANIKALFNRFGIKVGKADMDLLRLPAPRTSGKIADSPAVIEARTQEMRVALEDFLKDFNPGATTAKVTSSAGRLESDAAKSFNLLKQTVAGAKAGGQKLSKAALDKLDVTPRYAYGTQPTYNATSQSWERDGKPVNLLDSSGNLSEQSVYGTAPAPVTAPAPAVVPPAKPVTTPVAPQRDKQLDDLMAQISRLSQPLTLPTPYIPPAKTQAELETGADAGAKAIGLNRLFGDNFGKRLTTKETTPNPIGPRNALRFEFPMFSPQQIQGMTTDELTALDKYLGLKYNTTLQDVLEAQQMQFQAPPQAKRRLVRR